MAITLEAGVGLGASPIHRFGTEAQKQTWLPDLCAGRTLGAFGLTEPGAGSDAGSTRTTADLDDGSGEWVINGEKAFITNSGTALTAFVTVTARTGPGEISTILVPAGTPGFEVLPPYRKMGWHASDTHALAFTDSRVPEDHLLGERGRGYAQFLEILDEGRIAIAALAVGCIRACLEHCTQYAKDRSTFGAPIGTNQGVAFPIADLAVMAEAATALTYRAARLHDQGRPSKQAAAIAKLHATESAVTATRIATQVFGGYGVHRRDPGRPVLPRREDPRDRRGHQRGPAARDRARPRAARSMSWARPRRGRRTLRQRLLLTFSSVAVVALLATAGGLTYVYSKYSRLPRVELASVLAETVPSGEPRNFLLVGVDSAAELDADDPARAGRDDLGGLRSDTMMVLRLDPETDQAALLSLPRDLWVPLASGGNQRLNTAIQTGGPGELIDTIESNFGIPIHHYVQVDFAGFQDLVDVVDGVDVYFDAPARDSRSGLDVADDRVRHPRRRGRPRVRAGAALPALRGRSVAHRPERRPGADQPPAGLHRQRPGAGDRAGRAQPGHARPPGRCRPRDGHGRRPPQGGRHRGPRPGAAQLRPGSARAQDPAVRDGVVGGASILYLQEDEAQPILDQFRGTDVAALQPVDVRVQVLNGSGTAGQAVQTLDALTAAGFSTGGAGEADRFDFTESVVRYVEGGQAKAELVARYLDPAPQLELVPGPLDAEVVVVTGALHTGVLPTPRPAGPTTTQTTASTATTTTTLSLGDETTTTSVGFVPAAPPGVDC